jgi:hypothetical protein
LPVELVGADRPTSSKPTARSPREVSQWSGMERPNPNTRHAIDPQFAGLHRPSPPACSHRPPGFTGSRTGTPCATTLPRRLLGSESRRHGSPPSAGKKSGGV